ISGIASNSSTHRTIRISGYFSAASAPLRCRMAARCKPGTARITGAWNARPARPNPIKPTLIILRCFPVSYAGNSAIARNVWLRQNAMMSSKTQILEKASPSSQSMIFWLLCAGFVLNGIVISFIGPILPVFMAKWGLDDGRAGLFSLVQFSGSFTGVLLSSALVSAKGFKPAITLGLAMLTVRTSHVTPLLYVVGAICAALALVLSQMPFGKPPHESDSDPGATKVEPAGSGVAVMLGILFFVYVGTEVGTSYWATTHAQRAATWSSNAWTVAPMFFFAGLLGGRGAAAAILLRWKEVTVAVGGLLLAAAGELIFLAARSPVALFGGAFVAGLGLAGLFPIFIAWLSKWFGARARKVGGVMFALAAAGSALVPPLVGVVSRYSGSLRIGLLVPLAGCIAMLAVIGLLRPGARG